MCILIKIHLTKPVLAPLLQLSSLRNQAVVSTCIIQRLINLIHLLTQYEPVTITTSCHEIIHH